MVTDYIKKLGDVIRSDWDPLDAAGADVTAKTIAEVVLADLLKEFDASQGYSDIGTEEIIWQWAHERGIELREVRG